MISEKIKGWLNIDKKEEKEVVVEVPKKKEFKMAPEVKAPVREEDIVKKDGDGNRVPSYL